VSAIKAEVSEAIAEIRAAHLGHQVDFEPDGSGGAFVRVREIDLGPKYTPQKVWVGFQIVFQYPFADVYPHYFPSELRRADGNGLGEAFHTGNTFIRPTGSETAVMVSRRSNKRDPATETASIKLAKVIEWIRSR
jgi:hypothetical protein